MKESQRADSDQFSLDAPDDVSPALAWDKRGLIPAVVQDHSSGEVLMLAYMNEESLQRSVASGETWFWSRSRGELWHKGATSGHTQEITDIRYDCDADALLVQVIPNGPACHTGARSCFYRSIVPGGDEEVRFRKRSEASPKTPAADYGMLSRLEAIIAGRHRERPEDSYTTYLFEEGLDKILKKVGEEASEVVIAAKNESGERLRSEIGDLFYHVMVLMREADLSLEDVMRELAVRHADNDLYN